MSAKKSQDPSQLPESFETSDFDSKFGDDEISPIKNYLTRKYNTSMSVAIIKSRKIKFDNFYKFNELIIQNLWIKKGEVYCSTQDDFKFLKYEPDIPLYQKMIFRFRNCNMSPIMFYNQVDPANKNLLENYFGFEIIDIQVLDFLIWFECNYSSGYKKLIIQDILNQNLLINEISNTFDFILGIPTEKSEPILYEYREIIKKYLTDSFFNF